MKIIEMKKYFTTKQWGQVMQNIELNDENEKLKENGFFELENDSWSGVIQFMAHAFDFEKTTQGKDYWVNVVVKIIEKNGKKYLDVLQVIKDEIANGKLESTYLEEIEKSIFDKFEGDKKSIKNFTNSKFMNVDHLFAEIPVSNDVYLTYLNREHNYDLKLKKEYLESLPNEIVIISRIAYNAEVDLLFSVSGKSLPIWNEADLKQVKEVVTKVENRITGNEENTEKFKLFNAIVDALK
jgi:hypothetical protein